MRRKNFRDRHPGYSKGKMGMGSDIIYTNAVYEIREEYKIYEKILVLKTDTRQFQFASVFLLHKCSIVKFHYTKKTKKMSVIRKKNYFN